MAIPHGEIYFLRNVPINQSYEHTIDFKDKSEQFNYWLTYLKMSVTEYSYIRREREFISVGFTMQELEDVNYIIFRSQDGERLYYAFVTDKTYNTNGGTYVFYTIDVMQTYMNDYKWQASYIQQGHVDRWTAGHLPIYSKTDEGLYYGEEYAVESAYKLQQSPYLRWLLVTITDIEHFSNNEQFISSHVAPVNTAFTYLLVPCNTSYAAIPNVNIVNVGEGGTFIAKYNDLIYLMRKSGVGEYISSISLLTYNPFVETESVDVGAGVINVSLKGNQDFNTFQVENKHFLIIESANLSFLNSLNTLAITDWNNGIEDSLPTAEQWDEVKANPRTTQRDKRFESKLLCYPYRYNILTDWRNFPVVYKNEYLGGEKIEVKYKFALTANAPFRYWIKDYKKDPEGRNTTLVQSLSPDFPILSDKYYAYMYQNKNTIETNVINAKIQATANFVQGGVGGAINGGAPGAIVGGLMSGISGTVNVGNLIRSENAKQDDLQTLPATVINSNDSVFNILDNLDEINFYRMRVCCENEAILAEIFNMTGYKVNRVAIPNTRSRVRFNYIQTGGANIVGSFNQNDLGKIKEIYNKGITIWHYSEKDFNFMNYEYENIEVSLV